MLAFRTKVSDRWSDRLTPAGILHMALRGNEEQWWEHYPGRGAQYSPTFSLIWVSLLRDFAWWRDDPAFVRERLLGMRGVLEHFRTLRGSSGLLEHLAGWPFVDWVPAWQTGNAPEGVKGISSINNLFFVQALRHAAEVEDAYGDPAMAVRNRALGDELSREIIRRFWVTERSLLADDEQHKHFSEHGPCLALLNGVLAPTQADACFKALLEGRLDSEGDRCSGRITMPAGVKGVFVWRGQRKALLPEATTQLP